MSKKFICERTSMWDDDKQPCEEATKEGEGWVVEMENLQSLLSFADKYVEVIIKKKFGGEFALEIYDDYRE